MKHVHGEQIIPWTVAGGPGIAKISASNFPWSIGHLRLVATGGAEAFAYFGREFASVAEATADANSLQPGWDISSLFGVPSLRIHWNVGSDTLISIYCPGGSNGYLHFEQCKCADEERMIRALDAIAVKL